MCRKIDLIKSTGLGYTICTYSTAALPCPVLSFSPRGSMTFYTLGKMYMWMSRAKATAWYKQAFQIPDDNDNVAEVDGEDAAGNK